MKKKKIISMILAAVMICSSAVSVPMTTLAEETTAEQPEVQDDSTDAGEDSGKDATTDAGEDSGKDASTDAGEDSGKDASTDAGENQESDASKNGAENPGSDTATDSGDDQGTEGSDDSGKMTSDTDVSDSETLVSIAVLPEQYQVSVDEDGSYICLYKAEDENADSVALADCWLLAEISETGNNDEQTQSQTLCMWEILDPKTASAHPDAVLVCFNTDGKGQVTSDAYTGMADFFYAGDTTEYYVENGRILTGSSDICVSVNDTMYRVAADGRVSLYTGYYEGHCYTEGVMLKNMYILVNPLTEKNSSGNGDADPQTETSSDGYEDVNMPAEDGIAPYEQVDPTLYSDYPDAIIYQIHGNGSANLYTGSGVLRLTYDGKVYLYYVTAGKVQSIGKSRSIRQGGYLYYIAADSSASLYNGIYGSYFYIKGKIKTASGAYYVYYNHYIYKADKTGKAVKYTVKTGSDYYYIIVYQKNWKKYLCYANRKTAAARIVIADKNKTTYYQRLVGSRAYNVAYNTGRVSAFNGVYKGKYYVGGKVATSSASHYIIFKGYAYNVTKAGAAAVYIRSKSKSGTYILYVSGAFYYVYYSNGKVKGEATAAQAAAVSKTSSTVKPLSTTFTAGTSAARASVVRTAMSFLGTREDTPLHYEILGLYNSYSPLPRGTVMLWTYEWCAAFASAMFIKSGYTDLFPVDCSCKYQVQKWQSMGCWIENDAYVPKTGDIIYYHWNCKTKGDCKSTPNHVGIVVAVTGSTITTIEGNINGYKNSKGQNIRQVDYRNIKVNSSLIRGYASPKY